MLRKINLLMIVSALLLLMACSSSRSITEPVSIPKVDRIHLVPCGSPPIDGDYDPVIWLKDWVDWSHECSSGKQVLIDYINLLERER
jgi:hypothetical protein